MKFWKSVNSIKLFSLLSITKQMRAEQQIEQDIAREFENKKEQVTNIILGDDRIREILKDFDYEIEIKIKIKEIRNFSFLPTQ